MRRIVMVMLVAIGCSDAQAAQDYCALLSPADFTAAGVSGARTPTKNPDDRGAYCVYAGKSGATGGIEFDVFVTDGGADAKAVYGEVRYSGTKPEPAKTLPDADQSEVTKEPGPPAYTAIAVRKGKLVFGISVPTNPKAQEAVLSLARLVLQRADKLAR